MGVYRTAMGKNVDMSALRAKNEKVRAVGNVKNLNACGDTIDAFGKVIVPVTEKVGNAYAKTVGNRSAQVTQRKNPKIVADKLEPIVEIPSMEELTKEEIELENSMDDDIEIEKIKAKDKDSKK